jgi:tripartite-type tricarboxylate transporter receptor subunit TctC
MSIASAATGSPDLSSRIARLFACLAIVAFAMTAAVRAAEWPSRQVTIIVPFSAGGSTDILARVVAQHLQVKFGQPFVVENKSGASGAIGSAAVAKAAPDGYTLLIGTGGSQVTSPLTMKNSPFDPAELIPVALVAKLPGLIVVHPDIPAHTVPELIAYLKANPDKLSYGSSGTGTTTHLGIELFKAATGTRMTHVPFRGAGDNANAIAGGHVQLAMDIISVLLPQARGGTMRAIAVTSRERVASAPDIPTVGETLKDFEVVAWVGMMAPAGTPRPVVETLAAAVKRIVALADVKKNLDAVGGVAAATTPDEFGAFLGEERARWEVVIKGLGLLHSN